MNPTVKTFILLAALTAILGVVGYIFGGNNGLLVFVGLSAIMNIGAYWFSDKIALSMSGAQPLDRSQAPQLYADTEQLAARVGVPMPRMFISPQPQPNAFATGRNPQNGVVCVTQGLLQTLSREEVNGVIAHELSHIKHNDILITTVAAVIAGTVSSIANVALWFGGSDDEDRNPIFALIVVLVAPIAATLVQLAISRAREYGADEGAARAIGNGKPLADALIKIDGIARQYPMNINPALSSLYIANPLRGNGIFELFSTHPSTESRVQRLLNL